MQLKIIEPKAGDGHRIFLLWARAFEHDCLNNNLFPRLPASAPTVAPQNGNASFNNDSYVERRHPSVIPYLEKRWEEEIQKDDPRRYVRLMVDEDVEDSEGQPRIVGYFRANLPKPASVKAEDTEPKKENEAKDESDKKKDDSKPSVEGMDMTLYESMMVVQKEKAAEFMGPDEDYWYIPSLYTDPAYARKGIGRALLREGLREAEEQGKAVYLESSPAGYRLYKSEGFEDLGVAWVFNNEKYRGDGEYFEYEIISMVKRPTKRN